MKNVDDDGLDSGDLVQVGDNYKDVASALVLTHTSELVWCSDPLPLIHGDHRQLLGPRSKHRHKLIGI